MSAWSPTVLILGLREAFTGRRERRNWHSGLSADALRDVEAAVGPILSELEYLRRETIQEIDLRMLGLVPLGIILGVLWALVEAAKKGNFFLASAIYGMGGAMIGGGIAFYAPEKAYRAAYKSRIVPHLAARFGDLNYRAAQEPNLQRLADLSLIPGFGKKTVEDEIFGSYRGVRLNIVEANLETGGKNSSVVFNGLVVEMDFPGRFSGTTVVTKEAASWLGAIGDFACPTGLDRVRLEDPEFERRYQVYSTDQVGARALLTPAIMERIMELESHARRDPPRLLAEPGRLWVSIPKDEKENLFEPPSLSQPVDSGGEMLVELSRDIGSVLQFVDAVLDLDPLNRPPQAAEPTAQA